MVIDAYIPEEGDIVWLDFTPPLGSEQAGRRPGLVVSPKKYNKIGLALICPITSKQKGYPFEISLSSSDGFTSGVVLADQIRSLDWKARNASFKETAGSAVVDGVKDLLMLLIGK
nr:endoribonuclease MazF [uncultured Sphaerochaeta sp.]